MDDRGRVLPGDVADAEYVLNIYGETATLRGIVTNVGEWEGHTIVSVTGADDGSLSHISGSTGPVTLVHHRATAGARDAMREVMALCRSERQRERLEKIAIEKMGMSI